MTETLTPLGRVLRRVVTTIATSTVTEDTSYGYSSGGDSPAYSRPTAGGTVTTYLTSMGGLVDVGGTASWSLYNTHGDVLGTTNAAATYTAAPVADEFGIGTTPASRLGWLGQQQRPSVGGTVGGTVGVYRMGVRLYDPRLGRFLEVDPVEGGSANDYDYCNADPINCYDLGGTWPSLPHIDVVKPFKDAAKKVVATTAKAVVSTGKVVVSTVNDHRWQLGGLAVMTTCGLSGMTLCGAAAGTFLAAKEYSTARSGGTVRDHVYNVVSTVGWALPGAAAGAAGFSRTATLLLDAPDVVCSTARRCSSPGRPSR